MLVHLNTIASEAKEFKPTKRAVVGLTSRIYDPLGIISPIVISLKIFVQDLCEAKVGWDQKLTRKLQEKWQSIRASLCEAASFFVPQCYFSGVSQDVTSFNLCGFCDASLHAFAAVVYLALETHSGRYVKFMASKTHVAPVIV